MKLLITGAAGTIAPDLASRLSHDHKIRMSDVREADTPYEFVQADLADPDQVARAAVGVDAIVHLGAMAWDFDVRSKMIPANIYGTWNVFNEAQKAGIERIVFASTHHTVGFHHAENTLELTEEAEIRPDTYYAVTKVYGEALGRLMHERFQMKVYCLRIGYYMTEARIAEGITRAKEALILSPDDFAQIVGRCMSAATPEFGVYNCISNARRPWLSIEKAKRELGYQPKDSVETMFGDVPEQPDLTEADSAWLRGPLDSGPEH